MYLSRAAQVFCLLAIWLCCTSATVAQPPAAEQSELGLDLKLPPAVGSEAEEFKLKTLDDKTVSLEQLTANHKVVLLVLRGWPGYQCPICKRQVGEFLSKAEDFAKQGVEVVMIYPGPADWLGEYAKEFLGERTLPANFHFVIDPDYQFTNAWNLRWDEPRETAYPSTFIIGKGRKVEFAKISKTHGGRVSAATVLEELEKSGATQ